MNTTVQANKAQDFRRMHDRREVLLLPNAWDAVSARLAVRAGFAAVATTSGAVAWALGYPDGEAAPRDEVVAAVGRIARAVDCPVTADMEAGYGVTAAEVGETIRAVIAAGAVGVNLEDGVRATGALREIGEAAERIRAARAAAVQAGVPIYINARIDVFFRMPAASAEERLAEAVKRGKAFLAAGADGVFPIGLGDATVIAALVRELDCPVNIIARPGLPNLAGLAKLGVARVSVGTRLAMVGLSAVDRAMRELHATGGFDGLASELTHADLQGLFGGR